MIETTDTVLSYYAQPGPMTDPGRHAECYQGLPTDLSELVRMLQGLVVHIFWAERYGLKLTPERQAEVNIRPVEDKLTRLLALDSRPLTEERPLEKRLVCNCRDYATLLASFLRCQGVPARARCGFGTYFMPGHFEDHWVVDYWKSSEGRWVMVDSQLDELQQKMLRIDFDPLDMPAGKFILAGEAWHMIRQQGADPKKFGIFKYHGVDFVRGNVFREVLSFNKIEVLPWDGWGLMAQPTSRSTKAARALFDRAADLSAQSSPELREFYAQNPGFQVPAEWLPAR
jgi:hypothetical protein